MYKNSTFFHAQVKQIICKYLLPSYLYNAVFFCIFFRHNCQKCMVIHEKHPNVLQYKESKHNIFFTKWFACTMHAFTVMLQIGFLTCKREICFSTNITFFFERKCNETSFVLESKQTFDEPPKKYLTPQFRNSHSIRNA